MKKQILTSIAVASSIAISACSLGDNESASTDTKQNTVAEKDAKPEAFEGTVAGTNEEGQEALGQAMQDMFNSEDLKSSANGNVESGQSGLDNYDDTQLKRARANYAKVLESNPSDAEARFGHAFTGFALSFKTKAVTNMITEITNSKNPLQDFSGLGNDETETYEEGTSTTVNNEYSQSTSSILSRKLVSEAKADFPEVHEIQDVIDAAIIGAMKDAIVDLEVAYKDANFKMEITLDNRTRKIGHSEVGLMLSGLKTLKSILVWYVAWDFDFDQNGSYDFIANLKDVDKNIDIETGVNNLTKEQSAALNHITGLYTLGSKFLTVRPGYAAELSQIDETIKSAAQIAKESINSRPADDSYFINSSDLNNDNAKKITDVLDSIIKYSETNLVVDLPDSDHNIEIDFSKVFDQKDMKRNLPYYAFYKAEEWSKEKPVFYFTDSKGNKTADANTFIELSKKKLSDTENINEVSKLIHFQDPTLQGILPGMTSDKIWSILRDQAIAADKKEASYNN